MIHFRVKRKSLKVIDAYKNYKNWMFVDNDFTQIEILPPTLDVLKMMSDYGLTYVIKEFRNIVEYTEWDNLRYHFGTTSMFLMTRCLGTRFVSDALVSFMNNEPLPDSKDINREIDITRRWQSSKRKLTTITNICCYFSGFLVNDIYLNIAINWCAFKSEVLKEFPRNIIFRVIDYWYHTHFLC